ncbi:ATPase [Methanocaldococcus bathoardescens]|uniref:ATPase n=1 Tax=Methanocaldococcus bathoardescens TaxID=1301915 RepID=A0A076LAK7_9EURY|nr:ATP-binding protein [Methanocaldococcus bathoardescens]AIJ05226.1 ATPase [Methanocaldococcus bathoardescens]
MFVNREEELSFLEKLYKSDKKEVLILYGRRRVGKTELIKQFIKNINSEDVIYFLSDRSGLNANAERFYEKVAKKFNLPNVKVEDFRDAFNLLKIIPNNRIVVVIDEFSYLLEDKNTPAVFQHIIDEILDDRFFIILCGSLVGLMEGLMSYKNPLYGRRTAQLKLSPLKFLHVREYFKNVDIETVVKIYSVTGGIPMYFKLFKGEDFEKELNEVVFSKTSILYEEPEFILREEVGDVHRYYLILEALAKGYNRVSEISSVTGIEAKDLPKYLRVLMSLDLVEREVPITESLKSKKGRYKIKDNFFRFWFRFVYPNKSEIEIGMFKMDYLLFNKYVGEIFKDIVKEFLIELNKNDKLPFKFSKIGRWWHKGEEIDLIALNENDKKALFVEVKWKDLSVREVYGIFKDLERKAELVGLKDYDKYYCVFGRRIKGDIELEENYLVFDLQSILTL